MDYFRRSLEPEHTWRTLFRMVLLTAIAGAVYGYAIGSWRSPLQGLYAAAKFPLLLLLTAFGNCLVNSMLGQLLGSGLGFRQSLVAVLSSFAILAATVGALAPVALFLTASLPNRDSPEAWRSINALITLHTIIIACAGTAATLRLRELLSVTAGPVRAKRILIVWLAANLFFGAQLSWNFRPYFGSPELPVRILRDNPFDGTFYGAVFRAAAGVVAPTLRFPRHESNPPSSSPEPTDDHR